MEARRRKLKCVFCGRGNSVRDVCGQLHVAENERKHIAAHHKCMQYSAGLTQYTFRRFGGFKISKVKKEQNRGKKLRCCVKKCQAKGQTGATAGCAWGPCKKSYHFLCAQRLNKITSRRSRRSAKERKGSVMYLVFCSEEHKRKYLDQERHTGYRNETDDDSEDDREQNSTTSDEDDDNDSRDEGKYSSSSNRTSLRKSTRHVKQETDESPGSESCSDPQQGTGHGLLMKPKNRQGTKDSREEKGMPESTYSLQGQKRMSERQANDKAGSKKRKTKTLCEVKTSMPVKREKIKNSQQTMTLQGIRTKKPAQRKCVVKKGHKCASDGGDSDIGVTTESSEDDTSYSSLYSTPCKQTCLVKNTKEDNSSTGTDGSASTPSELGNHRKVESADAGQDNLDDDFSNEHHESSQSFLSLPSLKDLFDSDDSQDSQSLQDSQIGRSVVVKLERMSPSCICHSETSDDHSLQKEDRGTIENSPLAVKLERTSTLHEGHLDISDEDSPEEEDEGTSGSPSLDDDECLLILPTDARKFEPNAAQICQHIADKWEADITHVYNWSKLAPEAVGDKIMLGFIVCVTHAASCDRWDMMRLLLFDAETLHNECQKIQKDSTLVQVLDMPGNTDLKKSQVSFIVKMIGEHKMMILKDKGQRLVDISTFNGIHFVVLKISNITDPNHLIRDALKMSRLHLLSEKDLLLVIKPATSGQDPLEELSILKNWFTTRMQRIRKVLHCPVDEILYNCDAETVNLDEEFKSFVSEVEKLVTPKAGDDSLPLVIFIRSINKSILNFERYLEALGGNLVSTNGSQPVIFIFPVSNLSSHLLSGLRPPVYCWSAFDPAIKPITFTVASLAKDWLF